MVYLSVDSIGENVAVCEGDNGEKYELDICRLPTGVREGDILALGKDGQIKIDKSETDFRKNLASSLINRVLSKDKKNMRLTFE